MAMKKKRAARKPKKRAVKKQVAKTAFLTLRQFKKLTEVTRRQRISASHRRRAAMPEESAPAAPEPAIDLATGFDPYEDD